MIVGEVMEGKLLTSVKEASSLLCSSLPKNFFCTGSEFCIFRNVCMLIVKFLCGVKW